MSAVLTSSNLDYCRRAVASFPDHADIIIVCNSQDPFYVNEIMFSDLAENYQIVRTTSNGMPGLGKQSVINHFLSTDYTHLIQIDADDFLYSDGYDIIVDTVKQHSLDVLGLLNEDIYFDHKSFTDWKRLDFIKVADRVDVSAEKAAVVKNLFNDVTDLIGQEGCFFNRMVCVSRLAAEHINYNIDMVGLEDLRASCDLKLLHLENKLKYGLVETPNIYLYFKEIAEGNSFKIMQGDVEQVRELFYTNLDHDKQDKLQNGRLTVIEVTEKDSKFKRYRYALSHIKQYS